MGHISREGVHCSSLSRTAMARIGLATPSTQLPAANYNTDSPIAVPQMVTTSTSTGRAKLTPDDMLTQTVTNPAVSSTS